MAQKLVLPINKCVFSAGYKNAAYRKQQGYDHYGVDLFSENGLTVYACGDGTVIAAGMDGGELNQRLGNCVVIVYRDVQLPSGKLCDLACRMFHFSKLSVKAGDLVTRDTIIGQYGNTGSTTVQGKPMGYHLHIEFDSDTKFPQYAVGISGNGNIIKRGTLDSTINPSTVWHLGKNQSIWGKYEGWFTAGDVSLPELAEASGAPAACEGCNELRVQLAIATAACETLQNKLAQIAALAARN